jgi:hypothetical protein
MDLKDIEWDCAGCINIGEDGYSEGDSQGNAFMSHVTLI